MTHSSTIAAISTPPGKGGVAVIRISGTEAAEICEGIFKPRGKTAPKDAKRTQIYGYIISDGELIDDVMLTYFPAPNSYTGEDVVEISCHGGVLVTSRVLGAVLRAGARRAEAGEFTRRAFVNGKLSLTEADAIGLLLDAKSEGQLKLSRLDARERLGKRIDGIRESLTSLLGSVYARIDYPDEDLGDFTDEEMQAALENILGDVRSLLSTYRTGRAVRGGISTAIAGKPNAGKSTLYNMLTGSDSAIVTDIAGTTRDVLESEVTLGDLYLRLFDTAGIRNESTDVIEKIGIERSLERINTSELVLALFDSTSPLDREDEELLKTLSDAPGEKIALLTKCDLEPQCVEKAKRIEAAIPTVLRITRDDRDGAVSLLSDAVKTLFTDGRINISTDAVISSECQHSALLSTDEALASAISSLKSGLPSDLVCTEIEDALRHVSELDGKEVSEMVVADIFSRFCVGK